MASYLKFISLFVVFAVLIQSSSQRRNKLKIGSTCHSHGQCVSHCCVTIRGKPHKESTGTKMDLMSGFVVKSSCQPKGRLGERCHVDQQLANSDNDFCGKCDFPLQCGLTGVCVKDPHPKLQSQLSSIDYQE